MAKKRIVDLKFPAAGLDRSGSYRAQSPFATVDALNVRPFGPVEERLRGGSRPGLVRGFRGEIGAGGPVNLIGTVNFVKAVAEFAWNDPLEGGCYGRGWGAIPAMSGTPWIGTAPRLIEHIGQATVEQDGAQGVKRNFTDLDPAVLYKVGITIVPHGGAHHGTYFLAARSGPNGPNQDGVLARLNLSGTNGVFDGRLSVFVAGVEVERYAFDTTNSPTGQADAGVFQLEITGDLVKVYWLENLLLSKTITPQATTHVGFGIRSDDGGLCLVDDFHFIYTAKAEGAGEKLRRMTVAAAGGKFCRERVFGTLEPISGSVDLVSVRSLMGVEHTQKYYIADHDYARVAGTDGSITIDGRLTAPSVSDWTALGIDVNNDVVVISAGTEGVANGTYKIDAVYWNYLDLLYYDGNSDGICSFRVERAPKVFDPVADTLSIWSATAGDVPTGCTGIAAYSDSILLYGPASAPHTWMLSRQGDPRDWDFGRVDAGAAFLGQNSAGGQVGRPILAAAVFRNDFVVFGHPGELWLLRGDPRHGGRLDNLSRQVGIVGRFAWCWGPSGELVFLSRDGLYALPPGAQGAPEPLSRRRLPEELRDIRPYPGMTHVNLCYDTRFRGIHIWVTKIGESGRHFWFDWPTKSFWPVSLPSLMNPAIAETIPVPVGQRTLVLVGTQDGKLCYFDSRVNHDQGTNIPSHVCYGPIRLGNDYREGLVMEQTGVLARGSAAVDWTLYPGETHEDAAAMGDARASGTWKAGINPKDRPRVRGASAILKLASDGSGGPWAVERIGMILKTAGKQRL